jgi:hypothetical protein
VGQCRLLLLVTAGRHFAQGDGERSISARCSGPSFREWPAHYLSHRFVIVASLYLCCQFWLGGIFLGFARSGPSACECSTAPALLLGLGMRQTVQAAER